MTDQNWTVTSPQAIDIDGVSALKLGMIQGRFEVRIGDQPGVLVDISDVHGDPVDVAVSGGRLEIRHQLHGPQGWFKNLMETVNHTSANSATIRLTVPAGTEVEVGTVRGDGLVSGVTGPTRLNTVSGSVAAENTAGELHVNTVSGTVTVSGHHGILTARSVSGEVHAAGDFTNVRATTVSGDLTFELLGNTHDFGSNSVSGNLTVLLPHDVGADIVAKTASGTVVIDDQHYAQVSGTVETISGPDRQLMLVRTNSMSGRTSILHRAAPEGAGTGL